ncbi:MAG: 5'/3'-nucleotidase SurE [Candidatus Hodarchaeota archaeon]
MDKMSTDCVHLGINAIPPQPPQSIFSGINNGENYNFLFLIIFCLLKNTLLRE